MAVTRVRVTGPDLDEIRKRILTLPDQVSDRAETVMRDVVKEATLRLKQGILDAETPTGRAAQSQGLRGTAGRQRGQAERRADKRQGRGASLYDQAGGLVNRNKLNITARIGWPYGTPGYAYWQENSPKYGMHLLPDLRLWVDEEFKKRMGF